MRFPRSADGNLEAVLLNTSGGLTDGDTFSAELYWRSGTRATVTTQAAERVYRAATGEAARVSTRLTIDALCVAGWLPQETIVFDGGRLARTLEVDMTSTSCLVALEGMVFGRRAMGETVNHGRISDHWRVRVDGRLAYADHFLVDDRLTGRIGEYLSRASVANSASCIATMVVVAPHCDRIVENARNLILPPTATLGATCLDQVAILRILAGDSQAMRTAVSRIVASLGGTLDIGLPRVWHC